MAAEPFNSFRLVGGTSLSLQLGHRISVDIDLFTDVPYGSINFEALEDFLNNTFPYVSHLANVLPGMGKSYTVGADRDQAIKIDIYYTDKFIQPALIIDGIRMATTEEIIAMKIDVIQRGGRKKDFWDLYELLPKYSIRTMLALHKQRYEFGHDSNLILKNFTDFTQADGDFNPICLRGKYW
ncbi:nucleotidyl transferase AbiEii/AbiGii toxin family protein [Dyadobacter crusticola]|uniref:nucleotidyl transferase AbiEii/AbiGii toxin family protein n=1 Tax=Dyadobacter crusticola TaxID=292407 RepID=UPI000A875D29|nr:nucleotidyl transferase AbiEii/AbiGii toxin family protein [Dyadobacter crusticola]